MSLLGEASSLKNYHQNKWKFCNQSPAGFQKATAYINNNRKVLENWNKKPKTDPNASHKYFLLNIVWPIKGTTWFLWRYILQQGCIGQRQLVKSHVSWNTEERKTLNWGLMTQTEHRTCYDKPETSRYIAPISDCVFLVMGWMGNKTIQLVKKKLYCQDDSKPG